MRRSIAIVTLSALATVGSVVTAGPASAAPTQCTGTISNQQIYKDVEVPPGASCGLFGDKVYGNVTVDPTGTINMQHSTVYGSFSANQPGVPVPIFVFSDTINGSASIDGVPTGAPGIVCATTVRGNFTYADSGADSAFEVGGKGISRSGATQASCNTAPTIVSRSVTFSNNQGNFDFSGNQADSNVTASGNTDGGTINNNTIYSSLSCASNAPPVTADGNTVYGANTCPP